MMTVWYSNKLTHLVDQFLCNHKSELPPFPERTFATAQIVIPNRNIESYLKFEIARRASLAANLEFFFLEDFLTRRLSSTDKQQRLLRRTDLRAMLLHLMTAADSQNLPAPVRRYIELGPNDDARDRRRFQIANELARIFEAYSLSRRDMLRSWDIGTRCLTDQQSAAATEEWQMQLWRSLFTDQGPWQAAQEEKQTSLLPLHRYLGAWNADDAEAGKPVHLFGFSYIARTYQEILAQIGERTQVHLYTFLPTILGVEEAAPSPAVPSTICSTWATPGLENMKLLSRLPNCKLCRVVEKVEETTTFLQKLQAGILHCDFGRKHRDGNGQAGAAVSLEPDDSVRVLACPSIEREVEIIGNEIWSMIQNDDQRDGPRLCFHDIAIIVADRKRLDTYQAHFRSRFESLYDIPCNYADVSIFKESEFLQAVLLLLELPFGDWKRSDVLRLLTHPCHQARVSSADPGLWKRWTDELGIYFGVDKASLANTYIDKDVYNWDQGITRLTLGAFLGGEKVGVQETFEVSTGELVPKDFLQGDTPAAAAYVAVLRSLIADTNFARESRLSFTQWSTFLHHLVTSYLAPQSEAEEKDLGLCLRQIYRLRDSDVAGEPVSYRIAADALREGLESLTGSKGHFLADGVVISSFLPMRPIPFRVAFIAGLGEGCFPAQNRDNALDLRLAQPMPGDVTSRQRDEYLFLETLMSTSDRVVFSYVSRDPHTGDEMKPSAVLDGLFYTLAKDFGVQDPRNALTVHHPLHRFEVREGQEFDPNQVFDPATIGEVHTLRLRQELDKAFGGDAALPADAIRQLPRPVRQFLAVPSLPNEDPPPSEDSDESDVPELLQQKVEPAALPATLPLPLSVVRRFLECPLQAWGEMLLRLREDEEVDAMTVETEPREFSRLQQALLLRELFWSAIQSPESELSKLYDSRLAMAALSGSCPTGVFLETQREHHLRVLKNWRENLQILETPPLSDFRIVRYGRAEEYVGVDQLQPAIRVPLLGSASATTVELYGKSEALHLGKGVSVSLVAREKVKENDFLRGFVDYLAVAATGLCEHREYRAIVAPGEQCAEMETMERCWPAIDRQKATQYLSTLLTELVCNRHAYLLPSDAVVEAFSKDYRFTIEEIVNNLRYSHQPSYRSLYGPVPKPWMYDPPPEEEAMRMIQERWELFFSGRSRGNE